MTQTARIYRIQQWLLNPGAPVTFASMQQRLEVSPATLKRDLAYMRDQLQVPVEYDRLGGGYTIRHQRVGDRVELPGLWFSAPEMQALLTMHKLLADLDAGALLAPHVEPLMARICSLLSREGVATEQVLQRIQLKLAGQHRAVEHAVFQQVCNAVLARKRVQLLYHSRGRDETLPRELSPQRMLYYRDNWYLAAHCHVRNGLRVFSLDRMSAVQTLEQPALDTPTPQWEQVLEAGFGIYNGGPLHTAVLHFDADSSRWVRDQIWHLQQRMVALDDGSLQLHLPYLNPQEVLSEVLSWGAAVKVLSPPELQQQVLKALQASVARYL